MYGSSRYSYGSSETVLLPSGMGPGAVIGKQGSNIKMLGSRSGARFDVKAGYVVVSGTPTAVSEGVKMLNEQIASFQAQGGGYPHPLQVHYLLDRSFGNAHSTAVFRPADAQVARATDRHNEALFHLVPSQQQQQRRQLDVTPAVDRQQQLAHELAAMLAGVRLLDTGTSGGGRGCGSSTRSGEGTATAFLLEAEGGRAEALRGLLAALATGCAHTPAFDEIKLRFNWGKALFYRGPRAGEALGLAALQARRIPEDFKSVFSNGVAAGRAASVVARLRAACPGLRQVASKQSVSLHLVHRRSNAGFAVSMLRSAGGQLELRKIKCSTSKLFFLAQMSGASAAGEDWRAKLLGVYSHVSAPAALAAQLRELALSCRLAAGGSDLDLPSRERLHSADFVLDKLRCKSKSTFEGALALPSGGDMMVKVHVSLVTGQGGSGHTEVGGCSPDLNAELALALAASGGRLAPVRTARLQEMVAALLAFAERVSEAAAAKVPDILV